MLAIQRGLLAAKAAWVIQELPCFLAGILGLLYMYSSQTGYSVAAWLLMGMYTVHYTQRALIYPFFIKQGAQTKASAFVLALVFCLYNGYLQCRFLVLFDPYTAEEHASLRFIAGVLLFCTGMAINLHSDAILRNLRTERNPHFQPGTRYYIPRGGAFEFVSGANFFGEIVEWAGFAIAANSWVAFAFAAFTFANIGPRGAQHHQWLRAKFEDYPAHRRAVIPFLW